MLKKILRALFPLRYTMLREKTALLLFIPLLMSWFAFVVLLPEFWERYGIVEVFFSLLVNIWFFYCCSFKPIQKLFIKKGKRYEGRIIKGEVMNGSGQATYYLFIEFWKGKKKLIRRTSGYMGSPNIYLENDRCHIYEFMGKFIEADFNVRKKFPENKEECLNIKIEKHKMFMPKGNKYV